MRLYSISDFRSGSDNAMKNSYTRNYITLYKNRLKDSKLSKCFASYFEFVNAIIFDVHAKSCCKLHVPNVLRAHKLNVITLKIFYVATQPAR